MLLILWPVASDHVFGRRRWWQFVVQPRIKALRASIIYDQPQSPFVISKSRDGISENQEIL